MNVNKKFFMALWWFGIVVLLRVLPHVPNFIPMLAICIFTAKIFSKRMALLIIISSFMLSDVLVSFYSHYPMFSMWSLFTYSGIIATLLLASSTRSSLKKQTSNLITIIILTLISVLGYWVWTNFGVWLFSDIYAHTADGFVMCYMLALPFLKNSLLANATGLLILFAGFYLSRKLNLNFRHKGINRLLRYTSNDES